MIRQDGIDILVDLAGHTADNRLLVFARKPAPVQVTYLGYGDTTGLSAIDYRLTDAYADPPGLTERFHTEQLIRLSPAFLCYRPDDPCPEVAPLPASACPHITFGCFSNLAKVTPKVIAAWAAILRWVPGSRLLVKAKALADPPTAQSLRQSLARHGIDPDRVETLLPTASSFDHLRAYGRVDIALDTFPYNGVTTTCDALWMGVPVITLAGATHVWRVGMSLLANVGLWELIAATPDAYVSTAFRLAGDLDRLRHLRGTLRQRMLHSPLTDGGAFTRGLEAAFRRMWEKWCGAAA
jgi:predicted O-linked N-acetylglucosamine transferase (SPINDLY family)